MKNRKGWYGARALIAVVLLVGAYAMSGCATDANVHTTEELPTQVQQAYLPIKVGTLATDDLLPLWVAQHEGFLAQSGLEVEIITFQSPMESRAAMTAGEIDALMTDMVVAAQLSASEGARAVTVMQTAPAGILGSPTSGLSDLAGLSGKPIGISTPTVMEFIAEKALSDAGLTSEQIVFENIEKLPVRLEMLMNGKIVGAVLPWTLFQLAEQQGAVPLLDHDAAADYTSTVLVFRKAFLDQPEASHTIAALLTEWNGGVEAINADPDAYRALLIDKANLPEPLRENYRIRTYPRSGIPAQDQFEEIIEWMVAKDYLAERLSFEDLVYRR